MEKNIYITPAAKEVNLLTMQMMATSSTKVKLSNSTTDDDASMSNEKRDGWGDLWY